MFGSLFKSKAWAEKSDKKKIKQINNLVDSCVTNNC